MNKIKRNCRKMIAGILIVSMLSVVVSWEAFAMDNTVSIQKEQKVAEKKKMESNGGEENYKINKEDVIEEQKTIDSTTYDAGDGLLVTEYYAQPVRFEDERGELVDYDSSLVKIKEEELAEGEKLEGYSFENKQGDKKHYFPKKLTKATPILMENGDYQIKFVPIELAVSDTDLLSRNEAKIRMSTEGTEKTFDEENIVVDAKEATLKEEVVTDIYEEESKKDIKTAYSGIDGKTLYQYTSLEQGVKEEIVLEEKPENNQFAFLLEIPGLSIRNNSTDSGLTIYDGDDIVAGIHAPFMNDATGEAYSEELSYSVETIDEKTGCYRILLQVDQAYLNDEKRVYPVTIDPTFTWNTSSKIDEVYTLSGYSRSNFYDAGTSSFYLGKGVQGVSRVFIKLAGLGEISGKYVKKAVLSLYECTNSQSGKRISAYRITRDWSKSSVTWNNQPTYNGTAVANMTTKGPGGTPSLNLTSLFQGYANGSYANYGIMLKNNNENSNIDFVKFFGARHTTAKYRPKLTVEYYAKPTTANKVAVSPEYIKPGDSVKLAWTGITSGELSYIQHRIVEYDEVNKKELSVIKGYSASTKIGTTASGEANISVGSTVAEGTYKTYKIGVRGVGTSGAVGEEKVTYLKVDNAEPTGSIKVLAAGTAEEVSTLQDTVQIVGEVDGTGTPVKASSMRLYDREGNFIDDIYVGATQSRTEAKFTAEIPNGEYVLKLFIEDVVGNIKEITKEITVLNRVLAPTLQAVYTNQNTAVVNWEIPDNGTEIKGIAYKLSDSVEWTTITDIIGNKGSVTVRLPEEEGSYVVNVCGIDELGTYGTESSVTCVVDQVLPEVQIHETDRGMIFATAKDNNLENWTLSLKEEGSESEEVLHIGKNSLDNEYLGFFDRSKMEVGKNYELILRATDRAGNVNQISVVQSRTSEEVVAEEVKPTFRVKRPNYAGLSQNHIVYPADISRLELQAFSLLETVVDGDISWYCDDKRVSSEASWSQNLPTEEGKKHTILALAEKDGEVSYSQTYIKNRMLIPAIVGLRTELPDNCVSFRLNTGGEDGRATVLLDNGTEPITVENGITYHISQITNGEKATADHILIAASTEGDTVDWVIEADSVLEETFELSSIENYHPYEFAVKDKLNYKTYLNWNGIDGEWPENISYEIYRSQEKDFIPSDENLIAKDIKANYWAEMNINYSQEFYYKIRAVEKDSTGVVVKSGSFSNQISSTVIAVDEYVKRLGIKAYWEYAEFTTPSGNGYIEKSKGNLAYTQVDTEIPNEQLPVVLERTYNSQSTAKAAFGIGWTHSFDLELLNICKDNSYEFNNIVFKDGNGTLYLFNKNEKGEYVSSMGKYIMLKKEDRTEEVTLPENGTIGVENKEKKVKVVSTFTMTTKDKTEYRFNSSGQLIYLSEANGNFLLFEYEPNKGLLSKVTTSKNLTMEFLYFTEEDSLKRTIEPDLLTVKEIRLPDGSKMLYEYTDSRLSMVTKVGMDGKSTISWSLEYNEDKQLVALSDACGNKYQIAYEEEKTTKVIYPNSEAITLEYKEDGSTATYKEISKSGQTEQILLETNTFHASSGNSLTMTDSLGNEVSYEYTDNLRSKEIYSMTYYAVEDGNIVEKRTTKSDTKKYTDNDNLEKEVDEEGIVSEYTYIGGESSIAHLPATFTETNKEGMVITRERYTYDDYGNLIRRYDEVSGLVVETTYYTEDNAETGALKGEIKREVEYYLNDSDNQSSTTTTYKYLENGEKEEVITEVSGQYEVTTTNVYDVMGRLKYSIDTLGTETTNTYDPFGRIVKITVKQGDNVDVVTRQYNENGTLLKEVAEDGTIYSYTYDNINRLTSEAVNSDCWTIEYSYGSVDIQTGKGVETIENVLITTGKNPDGDVLAITYTDTLGRIVRQMKGGLYTDYTYDRENHVITCCQLGTNPENSKPILTVNLYDDKGCITGQVVRPGYDKTTGCFVIEEDSLTKSAEYDSTGNLISETDSLGNTTSYTYDAYGRIKTVTLPIKEGESQNITSYQYDQFSPERNGNTQNIVTDALGRTSVTTYNMAMQVVSISDKGDGTVNAIDQNYRYDEQGRVAVITDSLGNTTNYNYDAKDRVKSISYKNPSGNEVLRTSYTYDKADNIVSMSDYQISEGNATQYRYTGFTYDQHKRLKSLVEIDTTKNPAELTQDELAAHTTTYDYDKDGNLLSVVYPKSDWNVKSLRYVYDDKTKWLMSIKAMVLGEDTDTTKEVTLREYSYDNYGDVSEIKDYRALSKTGEVITDPDHTTCSYRYDAYRRPISMEYKDSIAPDTVKEAYTYKYDKNSRLIEETLMNLYPEEEMDRQNEVRTYTYDARGNLVETEIEDLIDSSNSHTLTYSYDMVGNRLSQTKMVGELTETTSYTYNSLNQMLTSKTTSAEGNIIENKIYSYDANGNQIQELDGVNNVTVTNTYDPVGRLSKYEKSENGTITLTQTNKYNGFGARIQKNENGQSNHYFYSQGGVLYTTDDAGKNTALNLLGVSGNIIATARNENNAESYYYYHKDPTGSITNLRNADGTSIVSYQYTDFGETSIYGDTEFYNEVCYNGSIYDKSTGLYYLKARYYNPEDGRFLARDSYRGDSAKPSTLHLYLYCTNNPIDYEDPSGHVPVLAVVKGVIGGVGGGILGYHIGKKISKKVKSPALKKAIVIGSIVAGATIGAVVGFKGVKSILKSAKTKIVKRAFTSAKTTVKNIATKVVSKTKQITPTQVAKFALKSVGGGVENAMISLAENAVTGENTPEKRREILKSSMIGSITSIGISSFGYKKESKVACKILVDIFANAVGAHAGCFAVRGTEDKGVIEAEGIIDGIVGAARSCTSVGAESLSQNINSGNIGIDFVVYGIVGLTKYSIISAEVMGGFAAKGTYQLLRN